MLSDTYGRKPILLLGLLALFASTVVSLIAVWLDWCGTHPFILFNPNPKLFGSIGAGHIPLYYLILINARALGRVLLCPSY